MRRQPNEELIVFKKDPAPISAIKAYMGATIFNPKWDLSMKRYILCGVREQLLNSNVVEIKAQVINLKHNQISLINQIIEVNFTRLKQLLLEGNNIESVENLSFLNSPALQSINLSENRIVNIRSFRKCLFPALLMIYLNRNKIANLQGLSECHFPRLQDIALELQIDLDAQKEDVTPIIKMECQMKWLFMVSEKRIKDWKVTFQKRWPQCEIRGKQGKRRRRMALNQIRNQVIW